MIKETPREQSFVLAKESELDEALTYLSTHAQHKSIQVDRQMLRVVFNAVNAERLPGSKLKLLSATVVRKYVPAKHKGNVRIIEAYTSGIMKMFSVRSVFARNRRSPPTTINPATVHPEGKHGQYLLL